jgi:inosine-uridine nucleoside N-ribohydrolase
MAPSVATAAPDATRDVESQAPTGKIHVIHDDDGSRDGTAALLYLLSRPEVSLDAISISYGEAHPQVYVQHIGRMLADLEIPAIPLGAGQDSPLAAATPFPDWLRQLSDSFWNITLPNADEAIPFQPAPELLVKTINEAAEPATLFVTGPFTNLAQALRIDPGIRGNIAAVYVMGGAVYAPGNIRNLIPEAENTVAEWNIYADPQAAKEAFESGLEIYLVPLDATSQVLFRFEDTTAWRAGDEKADLVADLYDIMFNEYGFTALDVFDLTSAVVMLNPEVCDFEPLHLDVVTAAGDTAGQTLVVPDAGPNAHVCLRPRADLAKQDLNETFSAPE